LLERTPSVLVTDDIAAIRDIVARVLTADGYVVETATEGPKAREKVGKRLFDLYLVDVAMPIMNGRELAAAIRSYHPSAKVLYITSTATICFKTGSCSKNQRRSSRNRSHRRTFERPCHCCCWVICEGRGAESSGVGILDEIYGDFQTAA